MDTTRECCVCWHLYDDDEKLPRILRCGHTFCSPCLQGILIYGFIICPTCRTQHAANCIDELQLNFALVQSKEPQQQDKAGGSYRKTLNLLREEQICSVKQTIMSCKGTSDKLAQHSTKLHNSVAKERELYGLLVTQLNKVKVSIDQVGEEAREVDKAIQEGTKLENELKNIMKCLSAANSSPEIAGALDLSDKTQQQMQTWKQGAEKKHLNDATTTRGAKTQAVMTEVLDRLHHNSTKDPYQTQYASLPTILGNLDLHRTQHTSIAASFVDSFRDVVGQTLLLQTDSVVGENVTAVTPLTFQLDRGFHQGCFISVAFKIHEKADRFYINLKTVNGPDANIPDANIALHVNPRFDQKVAIMNTKVKGHWSVGETRPLSILTPGSHAEISIVCDNDFKISINDKFWCSFNHRLPASDITHVEVVGSITVESITYNHGALAVTVVTPLYYLLGRSFQPGCLISVLFKIHEKADEFYINLQTSRGNDANIAFHLNPRFNQKGIIINSKIKGRWGKEERRNLSTLVPGSHSKISVRCEVKDFKILINDNFWCSFNHRLSASDITHVVVAGSITVDSLTYNYGV